MVCFNMESDYAIRIVQYLSARTDQRTDAARIAAETGITPRFALKILGRLTRGGLAKSYKGANGGYTLIRPPASITLYDVVEVISGGFFLTRCLDNDYTCNHPDDMSCRFHSVFCEINEQVVAKLKAVHFGREE